jgi:hypothetical protein
VRPRRADSPDCRNDGGRDDSIGAANAAIGFATAAAARNAVATIERIALPEDASERARRMRLVSDFMAQKCCPAFVLAKEVKEPDAIGVSYKERHAALSQIT